jgi:1,4-alpha-glucan branching enzyme
MVEEGLDIVRTCRDRYDGTVRNPFNEYECGHWYARALASYALIYGLTGIRYDAVEKALYLRPRIQGDFRSFLATATGYGTVGVKDGKPFYEIRDGDLEIKKLVYEPVALP